MVKEKLIELSNIQKLRTLTENESGQKSYNVTVVIKITILIYDSKISEQFES